MLRKLSWFFALGIAGIGISLKVRAVKGSSVSSLKETVPVPATGDSRPAPHRPEFVQQPFAPKKSVKKSVGAPSDAAIAAEFYDAASPPQQIVLLSERGRRVIESVAESTPRNSDKTLYLSNAAYIQQMAKQRALDAFSPHRDSLVPRDEKLNQSPLDSKAYRVVSFKPGKRDDGVSIIALPANLERAVLGPDFSLDNVLPNDEAGLADLRSRVVSFGHGGEMILEVTNGGYLVNGPGPDFRIYENVFRGFGKYNQEFAHVAVSETLEDADFVWFECDPDRNLIQSCAGVVPTAEGGDAFDLGEIGVQTARYLKIRDTGKNFNRGINTEGFDLDAVSWINGRAK